MPVSGVRNPAPFGGLACVDGMALVSSSPERLVLWNDERVETRPIAGTRPRDDQREEPEQRRAELLNHPKERAEHIMLIDLERNDLGRVCRPGSVRVEEFMSVESYAHVHHIVSSVTGAPLSDLEPAAVIRAVVPRWDHYRLPQGSLYADNRRT